MNAALSLPAKYGSSEKYSKFLPASGLRLMLTPGPNKTLTFSATASAPRRVAAVSTMIGFHELAMVADVGKQVDLIDSFKPR